MLIRIYFTIKYLYEVLNLFVINVQFLKYSLYVCINHIRVARIIKTRFIATTNNLNKKAINKSWLIYKYKFRLLHCSFLTKYGKCLYSRSCSVCQHQ